MNSKSTKDRMIQMPPLLNLAKNQWQIDNTISVFEKCNAPYMNNKLQPFYKRNIDGRAAYDFNGSRYEVIDGMLCKDEMPLFRVNNKHFVKEQLDNMNNVLAFDMSDSLSLKVTFDNVENKLNYNINNVMYSSSQLFYEGNIITVRVRFIGNTPYVVAYYKADGNVDKVLVSYLSGGTFNEIISNATWKKQYIRNNTSNPFTPSSMTNLNVYPLISIAQLSNDVIGISLVSQYGTTLNSNKTGFITYFLKEGAIYEYGVDLIPDNSTTSKVVITTNQAYFNVQVGQNVYNTIVKNAILKDGSFYEYIGTEGFGPELSFGDYVPTNTGNMATVQGEQYPLYTYQWTTSSLQVNTRSQAGTAWSFKVNNTESASDTNTLKTINMQTSYFGSNKLPFTIDSIKIVWEGAETVVPTSYYNGNSYLVTVSTESTQDIGWLTYPQIVCDNGNLYSMFCFTPEVGSTWSNPLTANNSLIESGRLNSTVVTGATMTYKVDALESVEINSNMTCIRSNGYTVGQGWFQSVVKLNNTTAQVPKNSSLAEPDTAVFTEYSNSNTYDLSYFPGTFRNSNDSYIDSITDQESYVIGNPIGGRERLGGPFNTLFNVLQSENAAYVQGVSYSETNEQMGTLLTEWSSIDNDFYVSANSTSFVYKDIYGKFWKISIEDGVDVYSILDNKYIVVNTTSYWNFYDAEKNKKFHYASDYNNRCQSGSATNIWNNRLLDKKKARTKNNAINGGYRIAPRDVIASIMFPLNTLVRCDAENEKLYKCSSPEDQDTQTIDIYFSDIGKTTAYYRFSITPLAIQNNHQRYDLIGSSWVDEEAGTLASPDIFTEYINGAGNNDFVKENTTNYVMQYYNNKAYLLYQLGSETDEVDAFFVIQGQFYGIINNKICSVLYNNGVLTEVDALVDLGDMKFIGNNPTIAFFWSPSQRAFYSWTGDANLAFIYAGSKFSTITGKFWYDYTSQSIFVATDNGLLVFGPKNTFLLEEYKNTEAVYFTNDGLTHIIDDNNTNDLSYYPREGFISNKVIIETEFFGFAPMVSTTVDKWAITFATDELDKSAEITVGVESITDMVVKSESKNMVIKPAEWDKASEAKLVNYNPALIKGQGLKLKISSDCGIAYIVPHISDNGYTMPSNKNI